MSSTALLATLGLAAPVEPPPPSLDTPAPQANEIVNRHRNFLKEREPEMTASEYALYERIVPMVETRPEFAIRILETMLADDEPESAAFDYILASVYVAGGRPDLGETRYRDAIKKHPEFLRAWFDLGLLYYSRERYKEAAPCFAEALRLGERSAQTYGLLGYSLRRSGNPLAAAMAYQQAFTLDATNTDWITGLLELYLETSQFAAAELLSNQLIRLKPEDGRHWLVHASILVHLNRRLDATAILEVAAGLGSLPDDGLQLLGDLYVEQRLFPEAVVAYERLMDRNPEQGGNRLLGYAQALIAEHRAAQAEAILERVDSTVTPALRPLLLRTRADLAIARGDLPRARQELERALALNPIDGEALLRLSEVHLTQGDVLRAEFLLEEVYRLSDYTYRASLELANLALKARQYDRSIQYLEKALSLEPSDALREYVIKIRALVPANATVAHRPST
jgi:tetratricopeptide (TPR) repeat protein